MKQLNAAAGPDRLPSPQKFSVKQQNLFPVHSIIFRTFLDSHDLPSNWKKSIISPKFKKGSPSDPSNYRPIALTSTCCKILESIIASELTDFLLKHNLISGHQHGFLKKQSTCTNLLETINDWTIHLSNRKAVVAAYNDFAKAFDTLQTLA